MGVADVSDGPPLLADGLRATSGDVPSPTADSPRRSSPRAPDLGAPPSYLEVGLWRDRIVASGAGSILNPAIRFDGNEIVVVDPVTGVDALFGAGESMRSLLAGIAAEPAQIDRLPESLRERLTGLGILVDETEAAAARREWDRTVRHAAQSFDDRGYAELPGFLCPAIIAFLRGRYRRMAREAALAYGDCQCPTRWTAHNEEAALPLHSALVPLVSAVVGRRVKASYLYLGVYAEGSHLPRHVDREQCEFTLSVLIDYLPDIERLSPWPLHLHVADETRSIHQGLGQSLLFAGRRIAHSRPHLFEGHMSTSIFFHFVDEDFLGSVD